jgi:DNA-binding NarL/FixJ family response regulator
MQLGHESPVTRSVRVLTIDDQEMFRSIARDVIAATAGFESVGEADGGESGIEAVGRLAPDLVLLDVRMPGLGGIDVARRLAATVLAALIFAAVYAVIAYRLIPLERVPMSL